MYMDAQNSNTMGETMELQEKYQVRYKGRKGRKKLQAIEEEIQRLRQETGGRYDGYEEMKLVDEVTDDILSIPQIGCTACKYCTPGCPMSISIPDVFRTINTLRRYPDDWRSKNFYQGVASRGGKASDCIGCGQCEGVCPQHLHIIDLLKEASAILD